MTFNGAPISACRASSRGMEAAAAVLKKLRISSG